MFSAWHSILLKNYEFDYIILMDADGGDRPVEILDLIFKIDKDPNTSIKKELKDQKGQFLGFFINAIKF